mmetsp:Transcript_8510/g.26686  ORF Transcript_8510/g.26686 Transcript_8510/m.26686 type:complete len:234 (+) Transcript_8510:1038-1739(+)
MDAKTAAGPPPPSSSASVTSAASSTAACARMASARADSASSSRIVAASCRPHASPTVSETPCRVTPTPSPPPRAKRSPSRPCSSAKSSKTRPSCWKREPRRALAASRHSCSGTLRSAGTSSRTHSYSSPHGTSEPFTSEGLPENSPAGASTSSRTKRLAHWSTAIREDAHGTSGKRPSATHALRTMTKASSSGMTEPVAVAMPMSPSCSGADGTPCDSKCRSHTASAAALVWR